MTPEEDRELDDFVAALRGEAGKTGAAGRLGETLRNRRRQALGNRDESAQMRAWRAIESKLPPAARPRATHGTWERMRLAQAAALVAVGIGTGWFLRPSMQTPMTESRLEFAYGDFERPRGSLIEKTIPAAAPAESLRALTDALIADTIPFELYSVAGGHRVLFAVPADANSRAARVLAQLGVETTAGETLSLTFAGAPGR
jgi:hypothetical protein